MIPTTDEIIEAGVKYTFAHRPMCMGGDEFDDFVQEFNRSISFEAGAEWALTQIAGKVLVAYCKSECDTDHLDCPHKEQGGCAKYKKFKSIYYGTIHNLRTATEQE